MKLYYTPLYKLSTHIPQVKSKQKKEKELRFRDPPRSSRGPQPITQTCKSLKHTPNTKNNNRINPNRIQNENPLWLKIQCHAINRVPSAIQKDQLPPPELLKLLKFYKIPESENKTTIYLKQKQILCSDLKRTHGFRIEVNSRKP